MFLSTESWWLNGAQRSLSSGVPNGGCTSSSPRLLQAIKVSVTLNRSKCGALTSLTFSTFLNYIFVFCLVCWFGFSLVLSFISLSLFVYLFMYLVLFLSFFLSFYPLFFFSCFHSFFVGFAYHNYILFLSFFRSLFLRTALPPPPPPFFLAYSYTLPFFRLSFLFFLVCFLRFFLSFSFSFVVFFRKVVSFLFSSYLTFCFS